MADLSDVENALTALVGQIAFPSGDIISIAGVRTTVQRGWPDGDKLDILLKQGGAFVSVFSKPGATRNTTRYQLTAQTMQAAPTLTGTVSGQTVTFGGIASAGQAVGIAWGSGVAEQAVTYRLTATDTPATVAAAIACRIAGATASNATLTVPGTPVVCRIVSDGQSRLEVRRQEQIVMVSVWAPTPEVRDRLTAGIDAAMACTPWMALPDGTSARVIYAGTMSSDKAQNANLYRRDLDYRVEYSTTVTETLPAMLFGILAETVNGAPVAPLIQ